MSFPLNIYAAAFLTAFLTTLLALPVWRKWCRRIGLVDDPGHRKIHETPVALAGGLAVSTGLILPLASAAIALLVIAPAGLTGLETAIAPSPPAAPRPGLDVAGLLGYGLSRRAPQLAAILLGAVGMVLLGCLDDKLELRASVKFGGQFVVAALLAVSGVRITLFVPSPLFSFAVTILWILTVTNAFNFMDNMNGLCAGLGVIGAWLFGLSAAVQGQYLVALLAFLASGALLGFLPYNFPKATAFLGDAGSHLVGYLLAVAAILPHFYSKENPNVWAVLRPLLILAVPLLDLIWVVLLRWRLGQPFYIGDTNHISHRLVRRGFTRTQAVLLIWALAAALGSLAFL